MKLSVVVCTYRRFDWLGKCLSSLNDQTLPPNDFRIIVVDNSLLPEQSDSFRNSLEAFKDLDYVTTTRSGLSFARNVALERCATPYIAYIDDDAIADQCWAEEVIKAFEKYSTAGVIGGRVLPLWESERPQWLKGFLLHHQAILDWGDKDIVITNDRWLVGANIAYRTEVLRRVGGFSDLLGRQGSLLLSHEELAVNFAIRDLGYDVLYVPKIAVDHLIQAERMTQEWLYRNSFCDGVSRVFLERGVKETNISDLSSFVESRFTEVSQGLPALNETTEIGNRTKEMQRLGERACNDFLGVKPNDGKPVSKDAKGWNVFYVLTTTFDASNTIDQTILSVVSQAGDFAIRYHVQDRGSKDGTLEKLEKWRWRFEKGTFPCLCKNIVFTFETEADEGPYDAIAKGFAKMVIPPPAYMCWINAGNMFLSGALSLVQAMARQLGPEHVMWLGGSVAVFEGEGLLPLGDEPLPTDAIRLGLCDGVHWNSVPHESTFFLNKLWKEAGAEAVIGRFKYAGDYHLWRLFAESGKYCQVPWLLGARKHIRDGKVSEASLASYWAEIDKMVEPQMRLQGLKSIASRKVIRTVIRQDKESGQFRLEEEDASRHAAYRFNKCFQNVAADSLNGLQPVTSGFPVKQPSEGNHPIPSAHSQSNEGTVVSGQDTATIEMPKKLGQDTGRPVSAALGPAPDPMKMHFAAGWHALENDHQSWWKWSWGVGYVQLKTAEAGKGRISFALASATENNRVTLKLNGSEIHAVAAGIALLTVGPLMVSVNSGTNVLEFSSENDFVTSERDPRSLSFMIKDLRFLPPKRRTIRRKLRRVVRKIEQSGLFYSSFYLQMVPEIKNCGTSPAEHYARYGAWENKDPNPLFSSAYYLAKNSDVYVSGENPLLHYIEKGASQGRDPHPKFSTIRYLSAYPEVKEAGMNPLFHYLRYGILEGRTRHPSS